MKHTDFIVATYKKHVIAGLSASILIFGGVILIGQIGSYESMKLIEAISPSARFLCSSIMTVSATTLALLLTVLSFGSNMKADFKKQHYHQVRYVALINTIVFIGSTILLLFITLPLGQSEESFRAYYEAIYYIIISSSALLGGLLITAVLLLYDIVNSFISVLNPDVDEVDIIENESR